jgi:hypothetical protein
LKCGACGNVSSFSDLFWHTCNDLWRMP